MSQGNSHIYCHQCAAKLPNFAKFCTQCGTSLASLSNRPEPPPEIQPKRQATFTPFIANGRDDDDEDNDVDRMQHYEPRLNKLELDVRTYPVQGEKLGAIAAKEERPFIEQRGSIIPGKITKKKQQEFLNQFAQEAGSNPVKPGQSTTVGGE